MPDATAPQTAHPERHLTIDPYELRRAELDKIQFATKHGIALNFVTQFFDIEQGRDQGGMNTRHVG